MPDSSLGATKTAINKVSDFMELEFEAVTSSHGEVSFQSLSRLEF